MAPSASLATYTPAGCAVFLGRALDQLVEGLELRAAPHDANGAGPGGGVGAGACVESPGSKAPLVIGHRLIVRIPDAE